MGGTPLRNFFAPVDGAPIPQEDHRPLKMPEQVFKEGSDIQTGEIAGAKLKIEGQAPSSRGDDQRTDRRDAVLVVPIVDEGRVPLGRPGAGHIGNEQEARLIEEDQRGSKSLGVFL